MYICILCIQSAAQPVGYHKHSQFNEYEIKLANKNLFHVLSNTHTCMYVYMHMYVYMYRYVHVHFKLATRCVGIPVKDYELNILRFQKLTSVSYQMLFDILNVTYKHININNNIHLGMLIFLCLSQYLCMFVCS